MLYALGRDSKGLYISKTGTRVEKGQYETVGTTSIKISHQLPTKARLLKLIEEHKTDIEANCWEEGKIDFIDFRGAGMEFAFYPLTYYKINEELLPKEEDEKYAQLNLFEEDQNKKILQYPIQKRNKNSQKKKIIG